MKILKSIKNKIQQFGYYEFAILLIAFFVRIYLIDNRPLHHDEGVNGWFVDGILSSGFYKYDPTNYHGPILFYPIFLCHVLLGRGELALRLPSVLTSVACVFLMLKFSKFLGRNTCLIAASFFALSPACVFNARYVSFDTYIIFFCMLILWGIIGLWTEGHKKYLWAIGLSIAGLLLTKETSFIYLICFVIAWICLKFYEKRNPSDVTAQAEKQWDFKDIQKIILASIVVLYVMYSGFFLYSDGVNAFINGFSTWLNTGTEKGDHFQPFNHWLKLMYRYELPALLGLGSCLFYLQQFNSKWIRYIAIYGFGVFLAHSIIPYKTPWLIIVFLWTFYFVLGDVISKFMNTKYRVQVILLYVILLCISTTIMYRVCFVNFADSTKEAYVYVHATKDLKEIIKPLKQLVAKDEANYNITGHVIRHDYWPLPYLLGDFTRIGYYDPGRSPGGYDADFIFLQEDRVMEVEPALMGKYFVDIYQIRDSQNKTRRYLKYETFKDLFPGREPVVLGQEEIIKDGKGLLAHFYQNKNWEGKPYLSRAVASPLFAWDYDTRPYASDFSVEVIGEVNVPSNTTKFVLETDDGGYLEIGDKRIIDDPGPHASQQAQGFYYGEPGWQKIKIGLYDIGGGSVLKLYWADQNGITTLVPKDAFRQLGGK